MGGGTIAKRDREQQRRARWVVVGLLSLLLGCASSPPPEPYTPSSGDDDVAPESEPPTLTPRFVPQLGHSADIACVGFASGGRAWLTASWDGSIKRWDLKTGALVGTMRGPAQDGPCIFSADGRRVASTRTDGSLVVWDVEAAKRIHTFKGQDEKLGAVAMTPDGRRVVAADVARRVTLWDAEAGKELSVLDHDFTVSAVAISPDGRWIATGGNELPKSEQVIEDDSGIDVPRRSQASVHLWDADTGTLVRKLPPHTDMVVAVAFSPDGSRIASASRKGRFVVYETESGKVLLRSEKLGQASGGESLYTFHELRFGADGARLYAATEQGVKVWQVADGTRVRGFPECGAEELAMSADGKYVGVRCGIRFVEIADAATGKLVQEPHSLPSPETRAAAPLPDGRHLLAVGYPGLIEMWDLQQLAPVRRFGRAHHGMAVSFAVSPDGKYVMTDQGVFDIPTGRFLASLPGLEDQTIPVGFSSDGRYASARDGVAGLIYDLREIGQTGSAPDSDEELPSAKLVGRIPGPLADIAFSPSRPQVAVAYLTGLKVHALDSLLRVDERVAELTLPAEDADVVFRAAFSPDGSLLATSSLPPIALSGGEVLIRQAPGEVALRDVATSQVRARLSGHETPVTVLAFDPTGKLLASGSWDGVIKLWDVATAKLMRTLDGHVDMVTSVSFSRDGRHLFSSGRDGTSRISRVDTGVSVALAASTEAWIAYSDDGYFAGSRNAGTLAAAVVGDEVYQVEQLAVTHNRPDLILERLGLGSPELIEYFAGRHARRAEKLGLAPGQIDPQARRPTARILDVKRDGDFADVSFELSAPSSTLTRYNVFCNDVPLLGSAGRTTTGSQQQLSLRVELTPGKNKIEVSATNQAGLESWRPFRVIDAGEGSGGDLYFIGFGVSRYQNPKLNLKYAAKDVLDLADLMRHMSGNQYPEVHVHTFVDDQVTPQQISDAKALLEKATVRDTVVLFVAGHGTYTRDEDPRYVYLTHDTDVRRLSETAADFELIEGLLDDIAPRDKLLLLDTCESGEREEPYAVASVALAGQRGLAARTTRALELVGAPTAEPISQRRRPFADRERFIYSNLTRRTGAIVLSSSLGSEFSYEHDSLQNGVFTEALLVALTGSEADEDGDQFVSTHELRKFVSGWVEKQTRGLQHPTVDRDNMNVWFGFPIAAAAAPILHRASVPPRAE